MCVIHMLLGRFNVTGDTLECCSLYPPRSSARQLANLCLLGARRRIQSENLLSTFAPLLRGCTADGYLLADEALEVDGLEILIVTLAVGRVRARHQPSKELIDRRARGKGGPEMRKRMWRCQKVFSVGFEILALRLVSSPQVCFV